MNHIVSPFYMSGYFYGMSGIVNFTLYDGYFCVSTNILDLCSLMWLLETVCGSCFKLMRWGEVTL